MVCIEQFDQFNRFFGLLSWDYKGYCRYLAVGMVLGGATLRCDIWTKCRRDNTREIMKGELVAMFGGFTAGTLPGGVTWFNVEFNDTDIMAYPSLSRLTGSSNISTGGAAVGPFGGSYTDLELGQAKSTSIVGWQAGFDLGSFDRFWGRSWLKGETKVECCNSSDDYY